MASAKEEKLARLALDRGLITIKQLSEARVRQRALKEKEGVEESLARVLLSAGFISDDDIRKIILAAETGDGEERGSSDRAQVVESEDEGTKSEGGTPTLKLPAQRPRDEHTKDPSRVIGGYEIIEQVGAGAVGDVYKARKAGSEQTFAVKVLSPAKASPEFIARFKREIEVACRLNHPNVVSCVEFGYDPARESHFYAMDFVDGEGLKARVERAGPLGEHEALVTARQVGMALRHAHENGLVHRDVKPENIMLTSSGHVKLLDLGLTRPVTRGESGLTVAGSFAGSPAYSSPEQARGESTVDIRSDIYSLGATLYYAVTGQQPFVGGTVGDVLAGHISGHIPWPADANPGLSHGTCLIIAKAMAKDPAERYQTPVELTLDLEIILQGIEPVIAKKAPADSTVGPPSTARPTPGPRPKSGVPTPRRARPHSGAKMAEQSGGGRAASGAVRRRSRSLKCASRKTTRSPRTGPAREARSSISWSLFCSAPWRQSSCCP